MTDLQGVTMMNFGLRTLFGAAAVAWAVAASTSASATDVPSVGRRPIPPDRDIVAPNSAAVASPVGLGRLREFSGTIVDLGCDDREALARGRCDQRAHEFALQLAGSRTLYPLWVFGDLPQFDDLRSGRFTGRHVRVTGAHYWSTGAILLGDIE